MAAEGMNLCLKCFLERKATKTLALQLALLGDWGKMAKELPMADKLIICNRLHRLENQKSRYIQRGPPAPQCHKLVP